MQLYFKLKHLWTSEIFLKPRKIRAKIVEAFGCAVFAIGSEILKISSENSIKRFTTTFEFAIIFRHTGY